jgi:hypothetical protein
MEQFLLSQKYHHICSVWLTSYRFDPFPEVVLWRFFECLVRGLCILNHGYEIAQLPAGHLHKPICEVIWETYDVVKWLTKMKTGHFDIKPQNSKASRQITHRGGD